MKKQNRCIYETAELPTAVYHECSDAQGTGKEAAFGLQNYLFTVIFTGI